MKSIESRIKDMRIFRNAKSGSVIDNLSVLNSFFTKEFTGKANDNIFIEKCLLYMSDEIET